MKSFILIFCIFEIINGINIRANNPIISFINLKNRSTTIYGLNSKYESVIQLPSKKMTYYQIDAGKSGKYTITKGSSVQVNKEGTITPRNVTWYWYGGIGYSTPQQGKTPDRVEKTFYPGISEVTAKVEDKSFVITVTVIEYGEEYAENIFDSYIKANVTNKKTVLEKFKSITAFPAQFPYNYRYQSYIDMVILKGGDCWASSNTIQHLCEKVGIKSHVRFAARDPNSGSGHRNVAALIDGKIYIGEAGYGQETPNRPYSVTEKNIGFFYRTSGKEITIYQYDGYDVDINVPSTIDNKTVIGFLYNCFYIGENWSGIKIQRISLPDSVTSLGTETFNNLKNLLEVNIPVNITELDLNVFKGCNNLKKINIAEKNTKFSSDYGVLFNKDKTNLIRCPPGKSGIYTAPSALKTVEDYSFNNTKDIEVVKFRNNVSYIGNYAFMNSNVKEIYFFGDPPKFGEKPFPDLNITFYYPENNNNWKSVNLLNLGLKDSRIVTWIPKLEENIDEVIEIDYSEENEENGQNEQNQEKKTSEKKSFAILAVVTIFIVLIIAIISFIICRKLRSKNSESINSLDGALVSNHY